MSSLTTSADRGKEGGPEETKGKGRKVKKAADWVGSFPEKKKKHICDCPCVSVHVNVCWLTTLRGRRVFVLLLRRSGQITEVLRLPSLLLSLSPAHSRLYRGGRTREARCRYVRRRMGDQQRKRRWRREREMQQDVRSYVMWACTTALPKAIRANSFQHRPKKTLLPLGRYIPLNMNTHQFFKCCLWNQTVWKAWYYNDSLSLFKCWGVRREAGEGKRYERHVSNGRKWWFLDGWVYHVLSITERFAGSLECRVSVCNKVTPLFNWQLMKT